MQTSEPQRLPSPWPLVLLLAFLSLASFGPTLWEVYHPTAHGFDASGFPYGHDFLNTWAGPRIAFSGHIRQLFDLDAYWRLLEAQFGHPVPVVNWSYPPSLLALLWPLSQAPYYAALALWVAVLTPVFVALGAQLPSPGRRVAAAVLLGFAPACLINALNGQNGFLTGALLLGGLQLLPRRPLLAGVAFGFLTVKPHLGFALAAALLALGSWRAILSAIATAGALVLQSVALFGVEPWRLYLHVTSAIQLSLLRVWDGFYTHAMTSVLATLRGDGVPFGLASIVQGCVTLAVLTITAWTMRRADDWKLRTAVVVVATPLATPYAFNYDLPALSAVLGWRLLDASNPLTPLRRIVYILAWLAPGILMRLSMSGPDLLAYPTLMAFVVLASEVAERKPQPVARSPRASLQPRCSLKSPTAAAAG